MKAYNKFIIQLYGIKIQERINLLSLWSAIYFFMLPLLNLRSIYYIC